MTQNIMGNSSSDFKNFGFENQARITMHTETQLKDLLPEKTKLKEQTDELDQLMRAGKQDLMNRYELN